MKTENPNDPNNMANIGLWFLKLLQQQGLSFVLLGVAIWYLVGRINQEEAKRENCQTMIIELYKTYYNEDKAVLDLIVKKLDDE